MWHLNAGEDATFIYLSSLRLQNAPRLKQNEAHSGSIMEILTGVKLDVILVFIVLLPIALAR
jgi:hypothetical protein